MPRRVVRVFVRSSALLWTLAALGLALTLVPARGRGAARPTLWGVWALGSAAAVFCGGSKLVSSYFLYVVPSFSLLGAYALQRLWDRAAWFGRRPALGLRAGLVASAVAVLLLGSGFQRAVTLRMLREYFPRHAVRTVEERLAADSSWVPRRGSLYIWGGETQLYLLSGSRPPTRHVHAFFLSRTHSARPSYLERRRELMRDLRAAPPAVILIDPRTDRLDLDGRLALRRSTFPDLEQLLAEHYRLVGQLEGWARYELVGPHADSPSEPPPDRPFVLGPGAPASDSGPPWRGPP